MARITDFDELEQFWGNPQTSKGIPFRITCKTGEPCSPRRKRTYWEAGTKWFMPMQLGSPVSRTVVCAPVNMTDQPETITFRE